MSLDSRLRLDSHKAYTKDTKRFTSWLGKEAAKYGVFPEKNPITIKDGLGNSETKYKISLREYVRMAESIFAHSPLNALPPQTQKTLERMIAKRKEHTVRFFGNNEVTAGDKGHVYAIGQFETILNILKRPAETKVGNEETYGKSDAQKSVQVHNDPSLSSPGNEASQPTRKDQQSTKNITTYEPDEFEDASFKLFCFLEDCNQMRHYLSLVWAKYGDGEANLTSASVLTDLAIQLVRRAEEQLLASLSHPLNSEYKNNFEKAVFHV